MVAAYTLDYGIYCKVYVLYDTVGLPVPQNHHWRGGKTFTCRLHTDLVRTCTERVLANEKELFFLMIRTA